jgi:CNT family concentrative nucleoside transporter
VLLARIIVPAEPDEARQDLELAGDKIYASSVDALIRGTSDGLTVVLNVGATLIVIVALVSIADRLLGLLPAVGGQPLGMARIFGVAFSPLAWSLGIPWSEARTAGALLGSKLVLTEFSAFIQMAKIGPQTLSERSRMIMTYALCGFANVASVGINVAGYGVLAPNRRDEVISLVWKAMLAGFLATCMTASIIGALPASLFGR